MKYRYITLLLLAACSSPDSGNDSESGQETTSAVEAVEREVEHILARTINYFGYDVYWGDVHAHTWASLDGRASDSPYAGTVGVNAGTYGTNGATMEALAVSNGLDFVFTTDHVNGPAGRAITDANSGDTHWRDVADDVEAFTSIIGIACAEVMYTEPSGTEHGHYTICPFGNTSTLTRNDMSPTGLNVNTSGTNSSDVANCVAIKNHWDAIQAEVDDGDAAQKEVIAIRHHPATIQPMRSNFGCQHTDYAVLYEIYSHWGNSDLKHATPAPDGSFYDPLLTAAAAQNADNRGTWTFADVNYGTNSSYRFGLVAGGDYHKTRPGHVCQNAGEPDTGKYGGGLTAVMLPTGTTWDEYALRDAMQAGNTYASSGPKVPMYAAAYVDSTHTFLGIPSRTPFTLSGTTTVQFEVDIPDGGTEDWEAEVVGVWIVKGNTCTGSTSASTCTQTRTALTETSAGHWEGDVSMSDPDSAWVEVKLDGLDSHPSGCNDGGADAYEYLWAQFYSN
jgi:hypothetical protein